MSRPRVILFDIDNTLLYSGGAGTHAMNLAFAELFGIEDGFAQIEFSGLTDLSILKRALGKSRIAGTAREHLDAFTAEYVRHLPQSLEEHDGRLMPGIPNLLAALKDAAATLGLATGNLSVGAKLKLDYFGLSSYFVGGGFGEVSLERVEVVGEAIRVVADGTPPEDVIVVGDTPHDVTSALANDAIGVGVATGHYTQDALRASGARAVYGDFADWQAACQALLALE